MTYITALLILLIAFYLAEHLYLQDNTKVYHIKIYHLLGFIILIMLPYLNIFASIITVLYVITKNSSHIDYFYNGIFNKAINKLITKYNNFLWLEV